MSPLHAEAYRSLGDASVLDHRFIEGRQVWQRGLKCFPEDVGLKERMSLTSLMVDGYVDRACSWEAGLDTDALSEIVGDLPELPQ